MRDGYVEVKSLLAMSSVIEDAVYAVQCAVGKEIVYAVGGSKCGSASSASQSKCGRSKASSASVKVLEERVGLE